jgi:hypothetical protein
MGYWKDAIRAVKKTFDYSAKLKRAEKATVIDTPLQNDSNTLEIKKVTAGAPYDEPTSWNGVINDLANHHTLEQLSLHVKSLKLPLKDPNFLATQQFSSQWKNGWKPPQKFYQLPDRTILAEIDANGRVRFDPAGVRLGAGAARKPAKPGA